MLKHFILAAALAATGQAACTRQSLTDITAAYIAAQKNGLPRVFATLASPSTVYTENGVAVPLTEGILAQSLKVDHAFSIHDTVQCGAFTELIAASDPHPYVIGTRILVGDDGKVKLMESIVTDEGDWAFNATGYLAWTSRESWAPIPQGKRDTRAAIQAAGDAYFDRFASANVSVPWGTPCARLEGGAYTGGRNLSANTCDLGLPSTIKVTDRRYIVDEEYGVVDMFLGFPGLDRSVGAQPMPDSHMFRVEGGKIRYIHTVSSCVHAGCGMDGAGPPTRRERRWRFRFNEQWSG